MKHIKLFEQFEYDDDPFGEEVNMNGYILAKNRTTDNIFIVRISTNDHGVEMLNFYKDCDHVIPSLYYILNPKISDNDSISIYDSKNEIEELPYSKNSKKWWKECRFGKLPQKIKDVLR